ncbi:hypothetical protein B0H63DRAFT_126477 [Podospora didyma]|uniref:Large ribosomal subunit protein uL23m n=1 Tax=Podospora didyma TaxID=330526 RepID=A0AAE0P025_9PEZI|nr:hypothetical protein B0H63DRAFT_126477 [Podospora didyma]
MARFSDYGFSPLLPSRPSHIIAFIRPKPRQPPTMATFVVPLKFNKLDLRDYLFHAYNVKVLAVRSFVNQPPPQRKNGVANGKWYRPRSMKMMIAELAQPFVWPDAPAVEDRTAFDYEIWNRMNSEREKSIAHQSAAQEGDIIMRSQQKLSGDRRQLQNEAKKLLKSAPRWTSETSAATKGEAWTEVEEGVKLEALDKKKY